jgi:hypothetical protein
VSDLLSDKVLFDKEILLKFVKEGLTREEEVFLDRDKNSISRLRLLMFSLLKAGRI